MSNMEDSTQLGSGFDRRSALKKAAVAGAVVWSTPMVLSSRVSATDVCTLKCLPEGSGDAVTFDIDGRKLTCEELDPVVRGQPGRQKRVFQIDTVDVTAGDTTCPCQEGADSTITFSTSTLQYEDPIPNQGTRTVPVGTISITFQCLDRQDRPLTRTCTYPVIAEFSGSCQGVGNTTFSLGASSGCVEACA